MDVMGLAFLATSSMGSAMREGDVESSGNTSSDILTAVLSDELKGLNTPVLDIQCKS